jgi:hypothetical protein
MARSLSLVSRYIHDASRTVRFQSIVCRNAVQIIGFAAVLDRTPLQYRTVRHLLISCCSRDRTWSLLVGRTVTFDMLMHVYRRALSAVPRILSLTAPTLRSLSLHFDWPSSEAFFPSHFPALVELSISQPWARWHLRSEELHQLVSYPSLRRLVLNGFVYIDDPTEIIDSIQRFAPSLTHLCLPSEPANTMTLTGTPNPSALLLALLHQRMDPPTSPENGVFPQTLELVLLHDRKLIKDDHIRPDDPRFILVSRSWIYARGSGPLELQWEHQWLDGINCGQGFWNKSDANGDGGVR